ncbi:MAG: AEC family transporter [Dongiaceae bacterium]
MFAQLAAIIAPVLLCAAIGFGWARLGRPFDSTFATSLATLVGTPALIGSTLTRYRLDPASLAEIGLAALAAFACFMAIAAAVLKLLRLPLPVYLPSLVFPNAGNMGLPLCLFAFGDAGLALAIVYFAIFSVLNFTVGVAITSGSLAPGRLLRLPLIYVVAAAIGIDLLGIELPAWFANTLQLLAGLTIPLMLLALGVSLARLKLGNVWRSLGLAVLRLALGIGVGLGLGLALGLSDRARGVLLIQSAMPVAVFNYLFAAVYGRAPGEVAGLVLLSTLLSFLSLPLLLLLALHGWPGL